MCRKEAIIMKKGANRVNQILNTIICCSVGIFIGHGLTVFTDYRKYHDLYTMQSAPWYSSILTYGIFTAVIVAIALMIKAVIAHKKPKN